MEVEDDVFFADLSKRISLLIMDDEEEVCSHGPCPSVSLQAFSHVYHPLSVPSPASYVQPCQRESKGTGVFIPRSSLPKRKNRSHNSKAHHKHPDNSRVSNNADLSCNYCNSRELRRN